MPYDVTTKDGITVRGIPDDIKPDDPRVKAKVVAARGGELPAAAAKPAAPAGKNVAQEETEKNSFLENAVLGVGKNLSETVLGGKQLANYVSGNRLFDKAKLEQEVKDNKMANDAISATGGGMVGDIGTSLLTSALPMGAVTKAAKFIPAVTGLKAVRAVAPSVVMGAGQAALTPDEDYSLGKELGTGGAAGLVGDVVGRGVGRVLKPMQKMIPDALKQKLADLPDDASLLAENITTSKPVKALSDALSQLPIVGSSIAKNREKNWGEATKLATRAAGHEVSELTPEAAATLHNKVGAQTAKLSEGYVPTTGIRPALARAQNENTLEAMLLGTTRPLNQMAGAEHAMALHAAGIPASGRPYSGLLDAEKAMKVRTELGDQVFRGEHGISSSGAEAIKDQLDKALRTRHGNQFDKALAEHGASLDVRALQAMPKNTGLSKEGHLSPQALRERMSDIEKANPSTPYSKQVNAMSDVFTAPPGSDNRSAMVRILMGSSLPAAASVLGAGSGIGTDSAATGLGVGAGSLGLATLLLGTKGGGRYLTGQNKSAVGKALQSDKAKELARLLATSGINRFAQ